MVKDLSEIFKECAELDTKKEKIEYLRANSNNQAFMILLKMLFDENLVWLIPPGMPKDYRDFHMIDMGHKLYSSIKTLYIYHANGNPNLKQEKREQMWAVLLESLTHNDAVLLCAIKDKKLPYKGITRKLIEEGLPGLL